MRALLVGDSMIKYLNDHLSNDSFHFDLDIVPYPGATIEELARKFSVLESSYDWILVHVGTNNASLDSIEVILQKYRSLANEILLFNPDANIIFSSIVPRGFNLFQQDYRKTADHLKVLNNKIMEINDALKKLCFDQEAFFFCSSYKASWDGYLGRDGLHPNRGNQFLANCFRRSLKSCILASKKIKDIFLPTEEVAAIVCYNKKQFVPQDTTTNVFLAVFTIAWARIQLYSEMDKLGDAVLYHDTDSIIYASNFRNDPPLRNFLGEFTDELNGETITTFISAGPKNSAYRKSSDEILINDSAKITRDGKKRRIFNKEKSKRYRIVYHKRVIKEDLSTIPCGF